MAENPCSPSGDSAPPRSVEDAVPSAAPSPTATSPGDGAARRTAKYVVRNIYESGEGHENPLQLPIFSHVPSIVHALLHSHYFTPEDWERWFRFYELSTRHKIPCDLFRNVEYLYTEKELDLQPGLRVLDIGTGASVFPFYLSRHNPGSMVILDLDDYGFADQRRYFATEGETPLPLLLRGDATRPPLGDACFDRIAAISAIEHFPGDGDMEFMRHAWRMLKPGGRCIVTVPYADTYQENPNVHHYHGGFERRYNRQAAAERLWSGGNWIVERELYMNPGKSAFARKLIARHGKLDTFFNLYYETRSNLRHSHDSLWYSLLLIDLADAPEPGCFGMCFTVRRPEQ